jgi:MFS family permease
MFMSCNVAFSSMPVFLPTIIKDMGYSSIHAQALSAPPYLVAFIVVILTAYYSDRYQTRAYPIIFHALLAATGYLILAISGYVKSENVMIRYMALYPAISGFFSAITIIITWNINNQDSDSKKGTGMAILNLIGQLGPLIGIRMFPDEDSPWYTNGMFVCATYMFCVAILAGGLRLWLAVHNWRLREEAIDYAGLPVEEGGSRPAGWKTFQYIL